MMLIATTSFKNIKICSGQMLLNNSLMLSALNPPLTSLSFLHLMSRCSTVRFFFSKNMCACYWTIKTLSTGKLSHGNSPHIAGFPPKWIADPPKMAGGSS